MSPAEELRRRRNRYVVMMAGRAACLILAALLTWWQVPLLALWVLLCLVGAVLLPWLAVVLANDRAPKKKSRPQPRSEPLAPEPVQTSLPRREHPTIIDVDP